MTSRPALGPLLVLALVSVAAEAIAEPVPQRPADDVYAQTFASAERLYAAGKAAEAAALYDRVVKMSPKKHLPAAARMAVVAWHKVVSAETASPGRADDTSPRPLSVSARRLLAACDTFIKQLPQSGELVPVLYRKARLFYERNHHTTAVIVFAEIATRHQQHELAVYAANLLLDSLNLLKRNDDLARWTRRFLANPTLTKDTEFKRQLERLDANIARQEIAALERSGRHRECGDGFLRLAERRPRDPRWVALLYNAAVCFASARLVDKAIQVRLMLVAKQPRDPLAEKALYDVAASYQALARFDRAAEHYERFATSYPGSREAPEALSSAIRFRLARGEMAKAMADARLFEKSYGARPRLAGLAAQISFSIGTIHEERGDQRAARQHYERYLQTWGVVSDTDHQLRAQVKIGELLWAESCPRGPAAAPWLRGLCVEQRRAKTGGRERRCGPPTVVASAVLPRRLSPARAAQAHFQRALALFRGPGATRQGGSREEQAVRQVAARSAAAAALFYQAEEAFEQLLLLQLPPGLDFSADDLLARPGSRRELDRYLRDTATKRDGAIRIYEDVIKMKIAHWAIAAVARIAGLYHASAEELFTAAVPRSARRADAFCAALKEKGVLLDVNAEEAYATCLAKSTELSWWNDWSTRCEAELHRRRPARYPLLEEIVTRPDHVPAGRTQRAPLMTAQP